MLRSILLLGCTMVLAGCITVKVEQSKPLEVHVAVDVSTDKALGDFFGDLDKKSATIAPAPAKP